MDIAISGASGFLGNRIYFHLLDNKFNVLGFSREKKRGLINCKDYFSLPEGDIIIHCAETNQRSKVNLAGEPMVQKSTELTKSLVKKYKKVIYLSSSAVYDNCQVLCQPSRNLKYFDEYSRMKITNENIVLDNGGIVIRPSNIYGDGMSKKNIFSETINQLKSPFPINIKNRSPIRDFLYVDDFVRIFPSLINNKFNEIFNVGSQKGYSIQSLVEVIIKVSGIKKEIIYHDEINDLSKIVLDISKTNRFLGWKPKLNLKEGLSKLSTISHE